MSSGFSSCRVCGLQLNSKNITDHELTCLQTSQEKMVTESDTDYESDDETHKKQNNPVIEIEYRGQRDVPVDDDEPEEEHFQHVDSSTRGEAEHVAIPLVHESNSRHRRDQEAALDRTESQDRKAADLKESSSALWAKIRKKRKDLFPPTKKYRYYPVTCEYCRKRFQPNRLKAHQQKHHPGEVFPSQSVPTAMGYDSAQGTAADRSKSVGAFPKNSRVCYICHRIYGSKSITIHEPQCLEKWRIQNEKLPPHQRALEPVKTESFLPGGNPVSDDASHSAPTFDPAAEVAYQNHLRTLVPCKHCSRTFSPDRIIKHESCCIERPKSRECATPPDGEIKR